MIDAARLSGTWTAADSRSMGLITTTRNAHIIVIFIKHRERVRTRSRRSTTETGNAPLARDG